MQECSQCHLSLSDAKFYKRTSGKLFSRCKRCVSIYGAQQYRKTREQKSEWGKAYYQKNRERILKQHRDYRLSQPPQKRFRKANLPWLREWKRHKRTTDIQFAIREKLRKAIWRRIQRAGASKRATTIQLLGCTIQEFLQHIETQWQPGMSWKNHGSVWHIDHIRPLASFDLTQHNEQLKAFHYSNTQPLWAADNLRKNAKWVQPA